MTRWSIVATLMLAGGAALAGPPGTMGQNQPPPPGMFLPPGTKLVGSASATDIRALPEINKGKAVSTEDLVGARAVDRIYETKGGYKVTVAYFDKMISDGQASQLERTSTKTSTAWSIRLPDGTQQNIVVRNTSPATIETLTAVGAIEQDTQIREHEPGSGQQQGQGPGQGQGTGKSDNPNMRLDEPNMKMESPGMRGPGSETPGLENPANPSKSNPPMGTPPMGNPTAPNPTR